MTYQVERSRPQQEFKEFVEKCRGAVIREAECTVLTMNPETSIVSA